MDLEKLHEKIETIEREIDRISSTLTTCKLQLENEMEKRHIHVENRLHNNEQDIKLHQKILFTVIGTVSLAVLYAALRNVGL